MPSSTSSLPGGSSSSSYSILPPTGGGPPQPGRTILLGEDTTTQPPKHHRHDPRGVHISRVPSSAFLAYTPEDFLQIGKEQHNSKPTNHGISLMRPISHQVDVGEPGLVKRDPRLAPYTSLFKNRLALYTTVMQRIREHHGGLHHFAKGFACFGLNRVVTADGRSGWLCREWLPNAKQARLMGDFNAWNRESHQLEKESISSQIDFGIYGRADGGLYGGDQVRGDKVYLYETQEGSDFQSNPAENPSEEEVAQKDWNGVWFTFLEDHADGSWAIQHRCKYRLYILSASDEWVDRVSAWSRLSWQNPDTGLFDSVLWCPLSSNSYTWSYPASSLQRSKNREAKTHYYDKTRKNDDAGAQPGSEGSWKIYEAHVGVSSVEQKVGTYTEFTNFLLPRIKRLGYNTLLLMGLLEHASYASFGWQVTNYFAPSSRCGTPDEFKRLVDAAHGMGIRVVVSLVHSHASTNVMDGLNQADGSEDGGYFLEGGRGTDHMWDGKIFDLQKTEVLRYLLSSIRWLAEQYRVDGFRFECITPMLYSRHLCPKFSYGNSVDEYFEHMDILDEKAALYCMLATDLAHEMGLTCIAAESSGFPGVCSLTAEGGLGFDFRYRSEIISKWTEIFCSRRDEDWDLASVIWPLADRQQCAIVAVEDSDTCRIGRRQLRIAMFSWESLHSHAVGGVSPHVTELAAGLSRRGHEAHLFVRATGNERKVYNIFGVYYHECVFALNSDFVKEMENMCESFINEMKNLEMEMGWNFDVCHAHDWLAAKSMMNCKRMGRRCVMTMHSTEFGRCGNNSYGGTSKRIRDVESEACHLADRVICVSGALAQEVRSQYGIGEDKTFVNYNGIHCSHFDGMENAGEIKSSYGIGVMDPMFLFVGRLVVQKGPDLLVEAVRHILHFRGDVKVAIVGEGHMRHDLETKSNQDGVSHAIKFLGRKVGAELKSLFKACDAVVIPSRNEPFGIVVLEAWSAWKPVVATTCGGPRDFVTHNVDGFLVDPNAGSIAWGCCEILKDFPHSRWMGSRGRVKAAYSFSWDSIANHTISLYYSICHKHDSLQCVQSCGDQSTAFRLMGGAMYDHMTVFDDNEQVQRGLSLHKLIRLVTCALGGDGYLNFMGNEFAHPEWIDMPRGANEFSYYHARRRWDLADNTELKFKHFELFDACLMHWEGLLGWLQSDRQHVTLCSNEDKVVAFERGDCLFVINFHPFSEYQNYCLGCSFIGVMKIALDTDESRFGGIDRLAAGHWEGVAVVKGEAIHELPNSIHLDLPPRTGMLLISDTLMKKLASRKLPNVISMEPDDFVRSLVDQQARQQDVPY